MNVPPADTLAALLAAIGKAPLGDLPGAGQVDKIVRRIVDNDAVAPKLDVAAFNSAI